MAIYEMLFSFFIYGFLGWCAEVAFAAVKTRKFVNRGFLNGPICPIYGIGITLVVVALNAYTENLFVLYLMSSVLATLLEYITGALLEKMFHHKWWDYSGMPFNIKGYICIPFSLIWGAACVIIVKLIYPVTYKIISFLPVWLGIVLLIVLCSLLISDICVTVSGIRKWNYRLSRMEEVAEELHRLSEQLGENIYQNMMAGMEKQEEVKKKHEELRQKYREMLDSQNRTEKRLLKAFPKLRSKKHGKQIEELKKYFEKKEK